MQARNDVFCMRASRVAPVPWKTLAQVQCAGADASAKDNVFGRKRTMLPCGEAQTTDLIWQAGNRRWDAWKIANYASWETLLRCYWKTILPCGRPVQRKFWLGPLKTGGDAVRARSVMQSTGADSLRDKPKTKRKRKSGQIKKLIYLNYPNQIV